MVVCAAQAAAVLVGLAITAVWPGGWWIDPVIGLAVAAAAVWEGRSSATAAVTGGPDWGLRTVAPAKGPCLDPATVRSEKNCEPLLVPADKPWAGWSRPGTWRGPDE